MAKLSALLEVRKRIGYLFQTPFFPSNLTSREFIEIQTSLSGVGLRTARERVATELTRFNMSDFLNQSPQKMSGGEKQRIALAAILAKNVDLLLLDEPTGSLDNENRAVFWNLLSELKGKELTLVAVTHDLEVKNLADFSHDLKNGQLV